MGYHPIITDETLQQAELVPIDVIPALKHTQTRYNNRKEHIREIFRRFINSNETRMAVMLKHNGTCPKKEAITILSRYMNMMAVELNLPFTVINHEQIIVLTRMRGINADKEREAIDRFKAIEEPKVIEIKFKG